jgi:hypothetical protein
MTYSVQGERALPTASGVAGLRTRALPPGAGNTFIAATLAIQDADVITKQAHLELPGVVSQRQGIRLLPVKDYPADAGQTKTNGGDQGSHPGSGRRADHPTAAGTRRAWHCSSAASKAARRRTRAG